VNRDAARTIALALLAVLALGVAAATIDTAVTGGSGGVGGGVGPATGIGPSDESGVGVDDTEGGTGTFGSLCLPALTEPAAIAGILAVFFGLLALVYYDTRSLFPVAVFGITFGIPGYVFWSLLTSCRGVEFTGTGLGASNGTFSLPQGGGGLPGAGEGPVAPPTAIFGFVLLLALLGAVALLFVSTGDDEVAERDAVDEDDDPVDVSELGRAAGAAADRIEDDADVENEVYRAWAEMTALLDIPNPRSSTPGEFASAAVEAGMARGDVDELTRLFEEVRYGGESATEDRETRAVTALRRIESTYGEGEES
jgi:hypothetical protein